MRGFLEAHGWRSLTLVTVDEIALLGDETIEVMIEVMCCSPMPSVTCAIKPSNLSSSTRPIN